MGKFRFVQLVSFSESSRPRPGNRGSALKAIQIPACALKAIWAGEVVLASWLGPDPRLAPCVTPNSCGYSNICCGALTLFPGKEGSACPGEECCGFISTRMISTTTTVSGTHTGIPRAPPPPPPPLAMLAPPTAVLVLDSYPLRRNLKPPGPDRLEKFERALLHTPVTHWHPLSGMGGGTPVPPPPHGLHT